MVIADTHSGNIRRRILLCFVMMVVIAGQPIVAAAVDTPRILFQELLQDSLEALWTGREPGPELQQKQKKIKKMLETGTVDKAGLEAMLSKAFLSILDEDKTSRYILRQLPGEAEALFSPVMTWPETRNVLWRSVASPVKKEEPVLIQVGTLAPPGTPWIDLAVNVIIPEIEKMTGGIIRVKVYGGGVMGEDIDILNKMDAGQLDGCGCTALGILATSPEMSVLLLPGLFNNYGEADYICEKFRKQIDTAFEERGYLLVALHETGFFYLFSKYKVTGLADIRKQKVVSWFGTMEGTLYQELGIKPIPVEVPDIIAALNIGTADTALIPAAWLLGMQAYQYVNYYFAQPLLYSPAAVFVTASTIDRLQKQLAVSDTFVHNFKELLVYEFNAREPEWKQQIRNYEEKTLKAFETKCGIRALTFSPEDQQAIEKANKAVGQKLAGKAFPGDLMDDIVKALEAYRARPQVVR